MIDCIHTQNIVCPHCGNNHTDSWEIDFGSGIEGDIEMECWECDKLFFVSRHCSISYSSEKMKGKAT